VPRPIDPQLIEILRDPSNGDPLELREQALHNARTGRRFPIIDGIPSLLSSQPLPLRHHVWRGFYDRAAFAYDGVVALGHRLGLGAEPTIRQQFLAEQPLPPQPRILEVGAGTAASRSHLPIDGLYLGLDISLGMLRRAQRRLAYEQLGGHLVHADALSLPLMDEGFDIILCMGVLQHLAAPRKALNEMARVARSGARVLVLDEVSSARRLLKRLAIAPSANPPAALAGALRPPACRLEAPPKLLGDYYALTLRKLPTSAG
jgi:ubiquinone/menaquinone biosynthesis C-methylase UbiE/uncharacterized protein YbaR (Trm112 family)